jgi:hypothetical protein
MTYLYIGSYIFMLWFSLSMGKGQYFGIWFMKVLKISSPLDLSKIGLE